ncbi:hypothetical protein [Thalassospira sp.]|uniref:hypothetical protein n=1 Tax=Thalassospira sp. TaxID=1912094 RepID=UPI00311D8AE0
MTNASQIVIFGLALTISDAINMALVATAIVSLFYTARSNNLNSRSLDVESYLKIYDRFQDLWNEYNPDRQSDEELENALANIVNNYEMICHLYNIKFLRGASREMLNSYLKETISQMVTTDRVVEFMSNSTSSESTYKEIELFCARNNIRNHMGWEFSPLRRLFVCIYTSIRPWIYKIPFVK